MSGQSRAHARNLLFAGVSAVAMVMGLTAGAAQAQDAKASGGDDTVVVVRGFRASLQTSLQQKRKADVELDAINADDIASFPDANLAESLQRIPGISITRDGGEGDKISVRGLAPDFSRVRINGMEALSTAGDSTASGNQPNRTRAFDFNTFASELFNNLSVRKTADAATDEGSLGATVDLRTARPFDYKGDKFAFSAQEAYYENGKHYDPRYTMLVSKRWDGGKMGWLGSVAYQKRETDISNYSRSPGASDYEFRSANFNGNEYPPRGGFAAPAGTTFPNTVTSYLTNPLSFNTTPYTTNPQLIAALTGSDPAAYAALYPAGYATAGRYDDSQVIIPALPSIGVQKLRTERLGLTSSFQMKPDENTQISLDVLYSDFKSYGDNYGISPIGLNRNNTFSTPSQFAASSSIATKRGLYAGTNCAANAGSTTVIAVDCGGTLYGTTPAFTTGSDGKAAVLGTNIFSVNPYNLEAYDYYNNKNSVGYINDPNGLGEVLSLIGRPSTKVLGAHVTNGVADYLELSNVDWRTNDDVSNYDTQFNQVTLDVNHTFTDRFKMEGELGVSKSTNNTEGFLVEFDDMDEQGHFIYDARGGGAMPEYNPGFDVSDPNKWSIVKGFSVIRHYVRKVENTYNSARFDFDWQKSDHNDFKFGFNARKYGFSTDQWQRSNSSSNNLELMIPTEKELGVTVASLGQEIQFGQGLKLPAGTPTSFFAPNLNAFIKATGLNCNCINKWGDWRLTDLVVSSGTAGGVEFAVDENDFGAYGEWSFNYHVPGGDLSGNLGLRQVSTKTDSVGRDSKNNRVEDRNEYNDTLPSMNLLYRPMDDLYIRAAIAKTMTRPLLSNLSPNIGSLTVATDGSSASMTLGNPRLEPIRSKNYDLAVEWYFNKNSLLSAALFYKEIKDFSQTVSYTAALSTLLNADEITALRSNSTNANYQAYLQADSPVTVRQTRNAPGGFLRGWEINYQQPFTFLPWKLKNTGLLLNLTHVDSKLKYILDPGSPVTSTSAATPVVYGNGPWLGASPDALNATLYYSTDTIDARISVSKRSDYYDTFPISAGNCSPGLNPVGTTATSQAYCTSPLILDFAGVKGTTNVDAKVTYNFTQHLAFTLEGLNLTNQTTNKFAYVANPVVTNYSSTGRQITVGVRYRY